MSATLARSPIFQDRKFYVPRFELFLGNQPVRKSILHDVMQVTYKDDVEKIDSFELTINNWDAETRTFKHHDSDLLNPEQTVRLHMGYLDDAKGLQLMMQGQIKEMTPTFPASGQPTVKVSGLNILDRFRQQQRSQTYKKGQTASQMAHEICTRLNVKFKNTAPSAIKETPHDHLIQDNQYDIVFLMALARDEGYEIVVKEGAGHDPPEIQFTRPSAQDRVAYELKYGATLIEFQPTLSTARQVSTVEIRGWDPVKGEPIQVEAGQAQAQDGGLKKRLKQGTTNPIPDRREVIATVPVRDKQAAMALAQARLSRINRELVKATGSTVGLPELRAGSQVYHWGLGQRFSGRYFVTSSTHTISMSGYLTQFECRLDELLDQSK